MIASALPPVLVPFVGYLDGLTDRPTLQALSERLTATAVTLGDVRHLAVFDDRHYRRNTIAEGPWYTLLVLCWKSGQRSPIHDHAESVCAFKVLTGVCSETVYAFSATGQVYPVHTENRPAGSIVATQDADTHQVSNLQAAPQDLVTLHIYSPPLKAMNKYSVTGEPQRAFSAAGNFDEDTYAI